MYIYIYIHIHIIYIKVYDSNEYTILRGIVYNNTNIYILVNSVINHANYFQLQKHLIKYSTSHSYVVTILHLEVFIINNIQYNNLLIIII